jgi:hypothetical protein
MTVIAARCEACNDSGLVWSLNESPWRGMVECPVCHGSKVETPPNTDPDKRTRQAIEGMERSNENV